MSEGTLYGWAFFTGKKILEELEDMYRDEKKVKKKMETILLNLRSEQLPDRFRRTLVDTIIEIMPEISLKSEIKEERPWRIEEFYRYSAAILAGFFDSLDAWKKEKEKAKNVKQEVKTENA